MALKIGILTFQWADNYGGLLQSYALKAYLIQNGYDVTVINYWPRNALKNRATRLGPTSVAKEFGVIVWPNFKLLAKNMILGRYRTSKILSQRMDAFRKTYITGSQKPYLDQLVIEKDFQGYDVLFCGSDQIWNPSLTGGGFDPVYFLKFESLKAVRASYAASLGVSLKKEWEEPFGTLLSQLEFISTRESSLAKIIKEQYGIEAETVVDPVFLLKPADWEKITSDKKRKEKYILLYVLERNPEVVTMANWLYHKVNLPIHVIGAKANYENPIYIKGCSIEEFVNQFKNAEYIVTNSFHGTAFSIIFQKQFMTIPHTKKPTRMIDLLTNVGLAKRIFNDNNQENIFTKIDYDNVYDLLRNETHKSRTYILNCINAAEKGE